MYRGLAYKIYIKLCDWLFKIVQHFSLVSFVKHALSDENIANGGVKGEESSVLQNGGHKP